MNNQEGFLSKPYGKRTDELWRTHWAYQSVGGRPSESQRPHSGLDAQNRCSTASFSACAADVPMEPIAERTGDGSTSRQDCHTHLVQAQVLWVILGVLRTNMDHNRLQWSQCDRRWAVVDWEWQAADGAQWAMGTFWGDLIGPQPNGSRQGWQPCREPLGCGPGSGRPKTSIAHAPSAACHSQSTTPNVVGTETPGGDPCGRTSATHRG